MAYINNKSRNFEQGLSRGREGEAMTGIFWFCLLRDWPIKRGMGAR